MGRVDGQRLEHGVDARVVVRGPAEGELELLAVCICCLVRSTKREWAREELRRLLFVLAEAAAGGGEFVAFVGRPKGNGLGEGKRCCSAARRRVGGLWLLWRGGTSPRAVAASSQRIAAGSER